uniref:malonyl-CoA:anthocyanidin 5-O-glucoside-6''-O-malonyltransferase-like n=1 Tax=Fragaria vesca subsp. vesca TaxID=101020 RepID=UPI0005C88F42|nr:PREDICTED: malonyl-CoA:anthocyanidin 5-O-glucoside-6''-O-malonyltransferase-like [Fragaria vesca subsp. vesca]
MANLSVKKVEVCRVAPKPGSPENQSLPLTLFDLFWLRFPPVERLYFYQTSSTDSVLSQLKTSLSLALQHFPPLAGNLIWPQDSLKPLLSYVQGDAVSVTVAESDADFDHLINSVFLAAKDFSHLVPQVDVTDERAAAMALQITVFPNRGFSIGTAMHHAVLDGKTSTSFVKAWAYICKHEELKIHSRSRLDPPIPATYFGNCIVGRVAVAETKGLLSEDGLVVAVSAITEALRSLEKGVLDGAEDWVSNFLDFSLYDRIYAIAGSHRFEVYDTDFGWGRPKRVEVISIDKTSAISLSDSKNGGGGVEVGLVLKKHYMEAFDALFSSLVH